MSARSRGRQRQPQPCLIKDCDNPALARDLCSKHYQRWLKRGTPLVAGEKFDPVKLLTVAARSMGLTR
jgi:hypothetical protein